MIQLGDGFRGHDNALCGLHAALRSRAYVHLNSDVTISICIYVNDGRPFWQIHSNSTGCSDSQYFEELYNYYMTDKAWHLCDPNAEECSKLLENQYRLR
ncbi:haloacid dehalogenase-like hydrolase domain-containing protein 3-like [Trifolium medium]|uniref:Haloacid dehalogenase-like hydrolase domain-containing protein 3-like n=1 Tax=Trifolium medium TaxID=97028 RepID=A0A392NKE6_9FABA|nr:haloacid dehalogenase-like hydrolase domain-containing protein 3-like [Trifolium medium]